MFRSLSFYSCLLIMAVLLTIRVRDSGLHSSKEHLMLTQWDAFGYYQYLPALFIYHDCKRLDWMPVVDKEYNVSGGDGFPVQQLENGNKVGKYLAGVAMLQAPFFAIAHFYSRYKHLPADGFSAPYQYAIGLGALIYVFLALLLLRKVLLRYFSEQVTGFSLILLCLASNLVQYAAVDAGLSHVWIFFLYALLLFLCVCWHQRPSSFLSFSIGFVIGLATICRPTEAIALFLPLLWGMYHVDSRRSKWASLKAHPVLIFWAIAGGIVGIFPQLLYWKMVTGSWIYDVGSKWFFLNPWFRVLFGWEKGWFIYTPVAILFVLGLFFMKARDFRLPVLVFCLLNIWIVISWEDWHYGASYSCRALVQSYPVFALALASLVNRTSQQKWMWGMMNVVGGYLVILNLFQVEQYHENILHYDEMNRAYYSRIYLNPHPNAYDMSLLDTRDFVSQEAGYKPVVLIQLSTSQEIRTNDKALLLDTLLEDAGMGHLKYLKLSVGIWAPCQTWQRHLLTVLQLGDTVKRSSIRMFNPVGNECGDYGWYFQIPEGFHQGRLKIILESPGTFHGMMNRIVVTGLCKESTSGVRLVRNQ